MLDEVLLPHGPILPDSLVEQQAPAFLPIVASIAAVFAAIALLYGIVSYYRMCKYFLVRNQARKQLEYIFSDNSNAAPAQRIYEANIVLKQVAQHYYHEEVIALYGEPWLTFLRNSLPKSVLQDKPTFLKNTLRLVYESHIKADISVAEQEFHLWLNQGLPQFSWLMLSPKKAAVELT